jgi:adenine-specific DNA-methyltransferase
MARLEDKIAEIPDAKLRQDIAAEVAELKKKTQFGLVFEAHQPEIVPLYAREVRRGERVARRSGKLTETFRVIKVREGFAECVKDADETQRESFPVGDLIVVRKVGEPIFPALTPLDSVRHGDPAQPHHILIEADNFHALQLLLFPYQGKVDCIYIDPPYNTGARDWKYNNDYVDGNDTWRHSKWLTFMERRLMLAKRLLNPENSALIVTVDEKEYLRLGLLLEQTFQDASIQAISVVINPKGVPRDGFSRVDEYVFFVQIGSCRPTGNITNSSGGKEVRWRGLTRTGSNGIRKKSPGAFYPIYFNYQGEIIEVGAALPIGQSVDSVAPQEGLIAVWPTPRPNGEDGRWSVVPETLKDLLSRGAVKTGLVKPKEGQFPIFYLTSKQLAAIESGELEVRGRTSSGAMRVHYHDDGGRISAPRTVWDKPSYSAGEHGTGLLQLIIPDRNFPYPKSLYSVRDVIRLYVADKPNALILDFFAGSGTTLNAVNLLNATDGGQRQCLLVTNNELSESEAKDLEAQGCRPGQDAWEAHGICRSVTFPRAKYTILGQRDDGTRLPGDYLTGRAVSKEKPRTVRQLGFAEGWKLDTKGRKQLAALIDDVPQNKIDDGPWFLDENAATTILWDVRQAEGWLEALAECGHVTDCLIVTAETKLFNALKAQALDVLGPLLAEEEAKRPLAQGFPANLEYFRLDFLDPDEVKIGRQFAGILPILWMTAGAKGQRPEPLAPSAPWLIPADCPFAVLMQETRFKDFHRHIQQRTDLTHVFIVTNSEETYRALREEIEGPIVIQLYKEYLENFRINLSENP